MLRAVVSKDLFASLESTAMQNPHHARRREGGKSFLKTQKSRQKLNAVWKQTNEEECELVSTFRWWRRNIAVCLKPKWLRRKRTQGLVSLTHLKIRSHLTKLAGKLKIANPRIESVGWNKSIAIQKTRNMEILIHCYPRPRNQPISFFKAKYNWNEESYLGNAIKG